MMNRHALFRNILTSGIKLSDPESIRKLKVFNGFQLSVIVIAPFLGLFFFCIGAISLFYVTVLAGLLMISSLLVLRKTKNVVLAGNYAILILWAMSADGLARLTMTCGAPLVTTTVFP